MELWIYENETLAAMLLDARRVATAPLNAGQLAGDKAQEAALAIVAELAGRGITA